MGDSSLVKMGSAGEVAQKGVEQDDLVMPVCCLPYVGSQETSHHLSFSLCPWHGAGSFILEDRPSEHHLPLLTTDR